MARLTAKGSTCPQVLQRNVTAQVTYLALATAAGEEVCRQLRRQVGIR